MTTQTAPPQYHIEHYIEYTTYELDLLPPNQWAYRPTEWQWSIHRLAWVNPHRSISRCIQVGYAVNESCARAQAETAILRLQDAEARS